MAFLEKRKRKFGDRKDGCVVKNASSLSICTASLYPKRCDNEVSMPVEFDITKLLKYIDEKNSKNPELNIKFFHCFIAALARVLNQRVQLNRFIQGAKIYERDEITISFVAKRKFNEKAEEVLLTYKAKPNDTVEDISKFILGEVTDIRKEENVSKKNDVGSTLDFFAKFPAVLRILVGMVLRTLDYWGIAPEIVTKGDPSFCTALVANIGSLNGGSAYHHLNNYGTTSMMYHIGTIKKKNILQEDGKIKTIDVVDVTITVDERIADGLYLVKSIKLLEDILLNPETLDIEVCEEYIPNYEGYYVR